MNEKRAAKKGAISIDYLITLIIAIIGFSLLLIFLYNVYWRQNIDREVCHESTVLRATLPVIAKSYMPLKCATEKICVTANFINGECDEFKGDKGIMTVRVSSGDRGVTEIEKLFAENLVDCWTMMGEGKVSLFSSFWFEKLGFGTAYPSCVICSRIAFDNESLIKKGVDLSKMDMEKYMLTHKVPNTDKSYFEYLGGKATAKGVVQEIEISPEEQTILDKFKEDTKVLDVSAEDISVEETISYPEDATEEEINRINQEYLALQNKKFAYQESAILFMQISAPSHEAVFENTMAVIFTAVLGNPISLKGTQSLTTLARAPAGGIKIGGKFFKGGQFLPKNVKAPTSALKGSLYAAAAVMAAMAVQHAHIANQRSITASKCQDIEVSSDARDGCSAVRSVPYNVTEIMSYCSAIESIP